MRAAPPGSVWGGRQEPFGRLKDALAEEPFVGMCNVTDLVQLVARAPGTQLDLWAAVLSTGILTRVFLKTVTCDPSPPPAMEKPLGARSERRGTRPLAGSKRNDAGGMPSKRPPDLGW